MALDKLKKELIEKAARDAQAQKNMRKAEAEKEQALLDYKNHQLPALQCLQLLEDFFWECVNDFSRLASLKIHYTNRPRVSWWTLRTRGSSLTIDDPKLYVSFDCSASWEFKTIQLEVFYQQGLQFTAEHGYTGHRVTGGGHIESKSYVRVRKNLSVESFEIQAARKWLESNFEEYYRRLNGVMIILD
jgi:hypothetical protein